jgi:hypothetical protein
MERLGRGYGKNLTLQERTREIDMAGAGIEPATRGFSVHCSAN